MPKSESRMLPVALTEGELRGYQKKLASVVVERDATEKEKKDYNDQAGASIKRLNGEISSLAKTIERKEEHRQVECLGRNEGGVWTVRRVDTGEVVESRAPQTAAEQQQELI